VGWPAIPYDGQLLVSHQDALLMGGKVQAAPGYADHVRFVYPDFCERCVSKMCIEMCSDQTITAGAGGVPAFDREKCIHCGACIWNFAVQLDKAVLETMSGRNTPVSPDRTTFRGPVLSPDWGGLEGEGLAPGTKPQKHCFVRLHILDGRIIHPGVAVQRAFLPSCSMLFPAPSQGRFLVNAATYHTVPEQSEAAVPIQQRC
jgi:NAD-dependent dihydropyrimidine dehydrogenase PreA subunit